MKIKTIVVDDELPICNEIAYLLQSHTDIEVVGKFDQSQAALDYLTKNSCDLVFLDINMPGMSGLEFAECVGTLKLKVLLVFVTAYEEYALTAFSTPAVGYVTKPVTQMKLTKALGKVRDLLQEVVEVRPRPTVTRITVAKNGRFYPVAKQDIVLAYVKNKEVYLRTLEGEFSVQMNFQELAEILQEQPFFRVHRQHIINLDFVAEVIPWFHGAYMIHMKGCENEDIPVSRAHLQELKQALGLR